MDVSVNGSYLFRGIFSNIYEILKMHIALDSSNFPSRHPLSEICSCAKIYVYKNYFSIICNRGKLLGIPVVRTPHSHFQEPGSVPGQGTTIPKAMWHYQKKKKKENYFRGKEPHVRKKGSVS